MKKILVKSSILVMPLHLAHNTDDTNRAKEKLNSEENYHISLLVI